MRPLVSIISLLAVACLPAQPGGTGPITVPASEWTWVEFPDSQCANGSSTGLGVNPGTDSHVVIYLMGGGACWDAATCYVAKSAWNVDLGYGVANFSGEAFRSIPLFDRRAAANPFRAASFVYVPYCTGDLHVGTSEQRYLTTQTTKHVGAKNLDAFLKRLTPTFAASRRVFVIGTSAGGFGAQMNAWRFVAAFPSSEVHVLADSAALVSPEGTRFADWTKSWAPERPPGCSDCETTPAAWTSAARKSLGSRRLGLINAEEDGLLTSFSGKSAEAYRTELRALVDTQFRSSSSAAFVVPGTRHVFLNEWASVQKNGVGLSAWLQAFRDGDGFTTP
jgi:hypothetical protein